MAYTKPISQWATFAQLGLFSSHIHFYVLFCRSYQGVADFICTDTVVCSFVV